MGQIFLATVLLGILSFSPAMAQQTQSPPASNRAGTYGEIYRSALDRIFPDPLTDEVPRGTIMSFVLRREPGLDPALGTESQIKVTITLGVEPLVEYFWAERRVTSVFDEILQVNLRPQPDEIAARVKISRKALKVSSSQAFKWQRDMLESVASTFASLPHETKGTYERGTFNITLDATTYQIWYSGGLDFKVAGADPASPFAKWADRFHSEVAAKFK